MFVERWQKKVKTYGDSTKLKYSYSNHIYLNEITKLNKNRVLQKIIHVMFNSEYLRQNEWLLHDA